MNYNIIPNYQAFQKLKEIEKLQEEMKEKKKAFELLCKLVGFNQAIEIFNAQEENKIQEIYEKY